VSDITVSVTSTGITVSVVSSSPGAISVGQQGPAGPPVPAGTNTRVLFSDNEAVGTHSGFTFDKTTGQLTLPGLVEQYNGATPQGFRLYNNRIDAANYERGGVEWNGTVLRFFTERAGTGAARGIVINSALGIQIGTSGTGRLLIGIDGHILPDSVDNTYDFGSVTWKFRSGHFGTSVIAPRLESATITFGGSGVNNAVLGSAALGLSSAHFLGWSGTADANSGTWDTRLHRDASSALALRGTTAAAFRMYEAFTDASNYSRLNFNYNTSALSFHISSQAAGTGTLRGLLLDGTQVLLATSGTTRYAASATDFSPYTNTGTDKTLDLGKATTRWRDARIGRHLYLDEKLILGAGAYITGSATLGGTIINTSSDLANVVMFREDQDTWLFGHTSPHATKNGAIDLGESGQQWRNGYFSSTVFTPGITSAANVNLLLNAGTGASVHLQSGGTSRWALDGQTNAFRPLDTNAYDLGSATATVRNGYFYGTVFGGEVGDGTTGFDLFRASPGGYGLFRNGTTTRVKAGGLVDLVVGATARLRATGSGVSLGSAINPSAWHSSIHALELGFSGNAVFSNGVTYVSNNAYNDAQWKHATTGAVALYAQTAGTHQWYGASSQAVGTVWNPATKMVLDSAATTTVLTLTGTTGNYIQLNNAGFAAPSFTTRSVGTKLLLWNQIGATDADYALGIDGAGNIWYGVPQATSTYGHRFYAGTTVIADIRGDKSFQLFNLRTDASNTEFGMARWTSNVYEIGTDAAGTGTLRNFRLHTRGGASILFAPGFGGGGDKWEMASTGHLSALGAYNITTTGLVTTTNLTVNGNPLVGATASNPKINFGSTANTALALRVNSISQDTLDVVRNDEAGYYNLRAWNVVSVNGVTSSGVGGIGYATGAGGTVTQLTNKNTGVTLNKVTGVITMAAGSLAADAVASFVLTNSTIAATDHVLVSVQGGGTGAGYLCTTVSAAGSCTVHVRNVSGGALDEQVQLRFTVIKSVNA
jgi:hypothetical protein